MRKTPLIVGAAAAAMVLGGGTSAFAMSHQVDVSVYGEETSVRMLSGTVQDALEAQGVTLKPTDKVTPSLQTPVDSSTEITVEHQRSVTVTVDGKTVKRLTTGTTVGDALAGYELPEGSVISPAPTTRLAAKGTQIVVTTPSTVTFAGQNGQATFSVIEPTVGEAAAAHLSDVQPTDRYYDEAGVPLDAASPVADGMTVRIERVRQSEVTSTQEVDFSTKTEEDPAAAQGTRTVKTPGVKGSKDVVTRTVTVDGTVAEETVVSETVTKEPVDEVVVKGTKAPQKAEPAPKESKTAPAKEASSADKPEPAPSSPSPEASDADQGGAPSGDVTTCKASHYGLNDGTDGGPTASGERFDASAMTAAHKTLPLGTRIRVTNTANGQSVVVRINDRGPYVSGRCLDLSSGAFDAIGDTGSGTMTVSYQRVG